ncbi:VOC family protein [Phytoactinopolyspora limicola]|uniref:VOC family protein n=1 Tax=Phytoactinopolyspora limicola TaxID=2715536 RepID=UPI0014091E56|nr:VOC family protein [Phytoactinopolyspora limicola]
MRLTYFYQPVPDLKAALAFYRDELGLNEAWREGDTTVAFELPGTPIQLMIDVAPDSGQQWKPGPFFEVDDVEQFAKERSGVTWAGPVIDVPGGKTAAFTDPGGNTIHVFDQSTTSDE